MARCLVMLARIRNGRFETVPDEKYGRMLPFRELPPMTLPQQVLPEGLPVRFIGAGSLEEDDLYLYYAVDKRFSGESAPMKERCRQQEPLGILISLIQKADRPQSFSVTKRDGEWILSTRDMEEELYQ